MTKVEEVARAIWDVHFAQMDALLSSMQPVAYTCGSCVFADIPPMPDNPGEGWIAHCTAPVPVNTLLNPTRVQRSFPAADAVRWEGKRLKPCPCWQARDGGRG